MTEEKDEINVILFDNGSWMVFGAICFGFLLMEVIGRAGAKARRKIKKVRWKLKDGKLVEEHSITPTTTDQKFRLHMFHPRCKCTEIPEGPAILNMKKAIKLGFRLERIENLHG